MDTALIVREVFQIVAQMRSEGLVRRRGVYFAMVTIALGRAPLDPGPPLPFLKA